MQADRLPITGEGATEQACSFEPIVHQPCTLVLVLSLLGTIVPRKRRRCIVCTNWTTGMGVSDGYFVRERTLKLSGLWRFICNGLNRFLMPKLHLQGCVWNSAFEPSSSVLRVNFLVILH